MKVELKIWVHEPERMETTMLLEEHDDLIVVTIPAKEKLVFGVDKREFLRVSEVLGK
jgi:hypothetical protein